MSTISNLKGCGAILAVIGLLAGCGVTYYDPARPPRGGGGPVGGGGQPELALFHIDPGVGVDLPDRNFAITTNGREWTLAWIGDLAFHRFTGQVVSGTRLGNVVFAGGFAGDTVAQRVENEVVFDATTDGGTLQSITMTSESEPLRFDLAIDGQDAVLQVVFTSNGVVSTSDEMPFELTTGFGVRGDAPKAQAGGAAAARAGGGATSAGTRFVPAPPAAR